MVKEFSEEKKREIFALLDEIDDKEWQSFEIWCRGRKLEFGDWIDKLGIRETLKPVEEYHRTILDLNENMRTQIATVFENVYSVDHYYAGEVGQQMEEVRRQMQVVQGLIQSINPEALLSDSVVNIDTKEEKTLRNYLIAEGITNSLEQQMIINMIRTEQPSLLKGIYVTDCYSSSDASAIMKLIMDYYNKHKNDDKIFHAKYLLDEYLKSYGYADSSERELIIRITEEKMLTYY